MRSYYESFGASVEEDLCGESSSAGDQDWSGGAWASRRSPENAGTGGISSDSKDREDEEWDGGRRAATPMRQPAWDGWSEDGSWGGRHTSWKEDDRRSAENWRFTGSEASREDDESWSWKTGGTGGGDDDRQSCENWSWKTGRTGGDWDRSSEVGWRRPALHKGTKAALYVEENYHDDLYYQAGSATEVTEDRKGIVRVVGEENSIEKEKEKKGGGKVSNTYPPVFRARPQESYAEWKRSVEFWIGGEGSQLPAELIGPRMMVQLRDRAAQLVKRLTNEDVNGPDGKYVIFRELEKAPLIKQVDRHKVDEHRRRLMQLNRAPHESIESYITRASLYRGQLLGLDSSLAMGEAFYVGHLLDHAHLSRGDDQD